MLAPVVDLEIVYPPASGSPHGVFEALAERADTMHASTLRDQAEINALMPSRFHGTNWLYDATMDAARGAVRTAALGEEPVDGSIVPELRWQLDAADGNVVAVWEYHRGAEWADPLVRDGLTALKAFMVRVNRPTGTNPAVNGIRYFEMRHDFRKADRIPGSIARVDVRNYGELGPSNWNGPENANGSIAVQPILQETPLWPGWTRNMLLFEINPQQDGWNYATWWMWHAVSGLVQVYDRVQIAAYNFVDFFAIHEDASSKRTPGAPPLSAYARNVWIGRNVSDVSELLAT